MMTILSVADFAARGDGTDQTVQVQAAYDALATAGGGTLYFPSGVYKIALDLTSRTVHVRGAGVGASILKPAAEEGVVLRALYASASWDPVEIADLTVEGIGTLKGTGFRFGPDSYAANAEYIGRTVFNRVAFLNLDKCIQRPFGNIGMWVNDCAFTTANYHFWCRANDGTDGDPMHAGNMIVSRGHLWDAKKAVAYIDGNGVNGAGQVVFADCIAEQCPGWVLYVKDFSGINTSPGITWRDGWNETNYTAGSVEVEEDEGPPGWGMFDGVSQVRIEDTPLGPLTLANGSNVVTDNCDLSMIESLDMSGNCALVHDNARLFTGTSRGLVRSIGGIHNIPAEVLNTPWFAMPRPTGLARLPADRILLLSNGQTEETWTGTNTRNTDEVDDDPGLVQLELAQDFFLDSSPTEAEYPATSFTLPSNKWILVQYVVKLLPGGEPIQVHINGLSGRLGVATICETAYRTLTSLTYNTDGASGEHLYHYGPAETDTTIRFVGYAITIWDDKQEALAFANSGLFPLDA